MKNLYNTNFVLGEGPIPCDIMMIGEAPGEDEDRMGRPFCGLSGNRLTKLIKQYSGYNRKDIYITNAVKQRPPRNRKPTLEEILSHREYLIQEIVMVNPKAIIALGKTALEGVLGREVSSLYTHFNRKISYNSSIRILVTYHPAALLRNSEYLKHIIKTFGEIKNAISKGKVQT